MNISYVKGNVTSPDFSTDYCLIPHCVNNLGVMGSGVAKALFTKWPVVKTHYHAFCNNWKLRQEELLGHCLFTVVDDRITVCQIFGQNGIIGPDNPKPVNYRALYKGFLAMRGIIEHDKRHTYSIHSPKLGSQLAGGTWDNVLRAIVATLGDLDIDYVVYEYGED